MNRMVLEDLKYFYLSKNKQLMRYLMNVAMRGHNRVELSRSRLEMMTVTRIEDFNIDQLTKDLKDVGITIYFAYENSNGKHYLIKW